MPVVTFDLSLRFLWSQKLFLNGLFWFPVTQLAVQRKQELGRRVKEPQKYVRASRDVWVCAGAERRTPLLQEEVGGASSSNKRAEMREKSFTSDVLQTTKDGENLELNS